MNTLALKHHSEMAEHLMIKHMHFSSRISRSYANLAR